VKKIVTSLILLFTVYAQAQEIAKDNIGNRVNIISVDANSITAMAKKSDKKNTLFYTFGIWCEPCRLHLPYAVKLAKEYDLNFYVLLVDSKDSKDRVSMAVGFIREIDKDLKIAILSDEVYGTKVKKRNRKFVTEITPAQFENIDDFSKYILLDNTGKVIMVTNYKDNDGDWKDDKKMVEKKIVPLL
jgi:thiol-disulfide isomerase/thioredoxin